MPPSTSSLDPARIVEAEFTAAASSADQIPHARGIEIAFAGRSNVGKSSLMNALCARRNLVRTSGTPGCTRQLAFFEVRTADGAELTLVDLPGYGFAKRSKAERKQWAGLIEGYLLQRPTLSVVAALTDLRRGIETDDQQLLELLALKPAIKRPPLTIVSVGTKLDKVPASKRAASELALKRQGGMTTCAVSTELPETYQRLWRLLRRAAGVGYVAPDVSA